jgi:hypothetical protein
MGGVATNRLVFQEFCHGPFDANMLGEEVYATWQHNPERADQLVCYTSEIAREGQTSD